MSQFDQLTRREREVVQVILDGSLSNHQIAKRLMVSKRTVQSHIGNILTKLHLTSRAELVLLAARSPEFIVQKADDNAGEVRYPATEEQLFYLFRVALPVEEMPPDMRQNLRERVIAAVRKINE